MRLMTSTGEKFTLDQYTAESAVLLSERLDPTSSKLLSYY